jgi:hypothetical protein
MSAVKHCHKAHNLSEIDSHDAAIDYPVGYSAAGDSSALHLGQEYCAPRTWSYARGPSVGSNQTGEGILGGCLSPIAVPWVGLEFPHRFGVAPSDEATGARRWPSVGWGHRAGVRLMGSVGRTVGWLPA